MSSSTGRGYVSRSLVHTLHIDSRYAKGRRSTSTGGLLNNNTNTCTFELKSSLKRVIGVNLKHLKIAVRWSKLPLKYTYEPLNSDNRSIVVEEGPNDNSSNRIVKLDVLVEESDFSNNQQEEGSSTPSPYGLLQRLKAFSSAQSPGLFNSINYDTETCRYIFRPNNNRQYRFPETPANVELLGMGAPFNNGNFITDGTRTFPGQRAIDHSPPTLYLHLSQGNVRSEQDVKYGNIIYVLNTPYYKRAGTSDRANELDIQEPCVFCEKNHIDQMVEMDGAEPDMSEVTLTWRLSNGDIANLLGTEWTATLEFFLAPDQGSHKSLHGMY